METMTVKLLSSQRHDYNQVGQDTDVEWAPVVVENGELVQSHPFFKCRDFWNEFVAARADGGFHSQYGFDIRGSDHVFPVGTHILITSSKIEAIKKGVKDLLNPVEEAAGLTKTSISKNGTVYLIEADDVWLSSPLLISTYTLALRNFYYYDKLLEKTKQPDFFGDWNNYYARLEQLNIGDTMIKSLRTYSPRWVIYGILANAKEFSFTKEGLTKALQGSGDCFIHSHSGLVSSMQYISGHNKVDFFRCGGTGKLLMEDKYAQLYPDINRLQEVIASSKPRKNAEQQAAWKIYYSNMTSTGASTGMFASRL